MKILPNIARYAIGVAVGALLWLVFIGSPEPIVYREIVVKQIKGEPVIERTFVDRVVYRDRSPELVAVQPAGGQDVVEDFCHPDTIEVVVGADTLWLPADTVFLLRSVATTNPWFFGRADITIWGPTSVGDLQEMRFRSWPGWSLRTDPEVLFREPRLGWIKPIIEAGVYVGVGFLAGRIF